MCKYLTEKIEFLFLDSSILNKLKYNRIETIENLWKLKKQDLKKMNFIDREIQQIIIKLQLVGIDLNKKTYSKLSKRSV